METVTTLELRKGNTVLRSGDMEWRVGKVVRGPHHTMVELTYPGVGSIRIPARNDATWNRKR